MVNIIVYLIDLVSEEMILPFVESVCSKWRLLGIVLGASQGDLLQICGDPMKCLQKVISLWLSGQCSKPPTLECLTNALRSFDMKENHIAAAIEQGNQHACMCCYVLKLK